MAKTLEKMIRNEKRDGTWSKWLVDRFGSNLPALSLSFGIDLLHDYTVEELEMLEDGDEFCLETSQLEEYLPECYKDKYNMEFLEMFLAEIDNLREIAEEGKPIIAEKPIQEIILRAAALEADDFADFMSETASEGSEYEMLNVEIERRRDSYLWKDWPYMLFDDDDVDLFLFNSGMSPYAEATSYAFDCWFDKVFWQGGAVEESEDGEQESVNA